MFLGLKLTSDDKLVGTPDGVLKVRTVRRKLESESSDAKRIEALTSCPPVAIEPSGSDKQEVQMQRDGEPTPRAFSIQKKRPGELWTRAELSWLLRCSKQQEALSADS